MWGVRQSDGQVNWTKSRMSKFTIVEPMSHPDISYTADSTCGETATGDLKVCPIRPVLKWKNLPACKLLKSF
jgi:uncharacterized protein YjdB